VSDLNQSYTSSHDLVGYRRFASLCKLVPVTKSSHLVFSHWPSEAYYRQLLDSITT